MRIPILIPSKGRPACDTVRLLNSLGNQDWGVFVEPQDRDKYGFGPLVQVLPENNQGIAYVRNYMIQWAKERKIPYFWMIDDDIQSIHWQDRKARRTVKFKQDPFPILNKHAELYLQQNHFAQMAIEYDQFSWSAKKDFYLNQYCDVFVCINTEICSRYSYDPQAVPKEDRDFTFSLVKSGERVVRLSRFSFKTGGIGSKKGGLEEVYKGDIKPALRHVMKKHPGYVSLVDKENRLDVKFHFEKL